jgi:hypothetical protein
MTSFTRATRSDVSDFRDSPSGVTFDAGPGNDFVLGSRFADTFLGGSGLDALFGKRGDDTLQGGADLDAARGGCGNDTFVFAAGDLITSRARDNGTFGLVDTVLDFHGAGTSGSGQQDLIRLEDFSADASLRFAGYGPTRALQYYEVVDPSTPGADGFILVAMADGTRRLTTDDVVFAQEPTLDLVTANFNDDSVSLLLGNGTGGFAAAGPNLRVGDAPFSVALGDLDGDGDLDLVTANLADESVTVLLGDGAGGFVDRGQDPAVGDAPFSVALGDLDGDGDLDLVASLSGIGSVSVLLGDGAGGFADAGPDPAVGGGFSLALGDLDGDGDLDLVTANIIGDGIDDSISVLLGDGVGGFAAAGPDPAVGSGPREVALGDLTASCENPESRRIEVLCRRLGL